MSSGASFESSSRDGVVGFGSSAVGSNAVGSNAVGSSAVGAITVGSDPSFGSFLKSRSEEVRLTVYGVVYDIITGPRDLHHKPMALQMTRAELRKEQPQIFSLLKTEWHVACIAYHDGKKIVPGLPPLPPEVHDFVFPLEREEVVQVTENLEFLRLVSVVPGGLHDELVAASIRSAAKARHEEYQYLVQAGQHLSKLFRDDYDRLGAVLRKIHPSTY